MKKIIILLMILGSLLYSKQNLTPEVKALLKQAKSNLKGVHAQKLDRLISKEKVILIDIRDPQEWTKGVIKSDNLVKISRGLLEIEYPKLILENYDKNDFFVVYCGLGPRSIFAAQRLKELGFKNVSYLKGGIKNWKRQGYAISK